MNERRIGVAAALVLMLFAAPADLHAAGKVRIAAVLALTGDAAQYGVPAKKGIDLAVKEVNERAGPDGTRMEVVYYDTKTDPRVAAALVNDVAQAGIQVIIGDVSSDCAIAMAAIAEKMHIIMISPGASTPDLSRYGDFVFRNWQSDLHEGETDAKFAFDHLKWRRVGVVWVDHAYGRGLANAFSDKFRALGGTGIAVKLDKPTLSAPDVEKLRTQKLDGIFVAAYTDDIQQILIQKRDAHLELPVLTVQSFENVKADAPGVEGVYFSAVPKPSEGDPAAAEFIGDYRRAYGENPMLCSDTGYDAMQIVARIMSAGARTPEQIRDQLRAISYPGAAGLTVFDEDGDVRKPILFKQIRNGRIEAVSESYAPKPASVAQNPPPAAPQPQSPSQSQSQSQSQSRLDRIVVSVLATIAGVIVLALLKKYGAQLYSWYQWRSLTLRFAFKQIIRRIGIRIVTMDDYVEVLEEMRDYTERKCRQSKSEKPEMLIHVFTRQIPRDWPLWQETFDPTKNTSALEEYFFRFQEFLKRAESAKYTVTIRRVIVIDSVRSPRGEERVRWLRDDVRSEYFSTYVSMLHRNESEAFYCLHDRMWPSWLSDSVFYGIRENGSISWLWAATTSYAGGDDLILLRVHKLGGKKRLSPALRLPWAITQTLEQVAENATTESLNIHPIAKIVTATS